ncbi:MAG: YbhB/YbcL family Raf kinase inhibitor-like protein [Methanomicrobiales archaeon HGW-Methanomicrobiales-1]|nr:MAG: YbhB/YbcL family Raf kinase inhibitor-like protein [Methanomicrobiales archaeon HGW-Methanomicrobiales-1]
MVRRNAYYPACSCQVMDNRRSMLPAVILIVLLISSGCTTNVQSSSVPDSPTPGQPGYPQTPSSAPSDAFTLTVDSLVSGSALPEVYSCKGASESPAVSWVGVPVGTKSLVLILEDPDASSGTFTHWLVYNIPVGSNTIPGGQTARKVLENGAQQGDTSAGSRGYYPPCPPIGTTHRYIFRLYAVDIDITQPTADRESIDMALQGHTIAKAEFLTTFTR